MMYWKSNSLLLGLKFFDKCGKVLLSVGKIDIPNARKHPENYGLISFKLKEGELLLGIKSSQEGFKDARHQNF